MAETFKLDLTSREQRVVEMCQSINFGEIRDLHVQGGQPLLTPPPVIRRDIKLGADAGPRPELGRQNFKVKAAVLQLLEVLQDVGNGVIPLIEVKSGLPFRIVVQETATF